MDIHYILVRKLDKKKSTREFQVAPFYKRYTTGGRSNDKIHTVQLDGLNFTFFPIFKILFDSLDNNASNNLLYSIF